MSTFQQLFDVARLTLNDDDADRIDDTTHLLPYANHAMKVLYRVSPYLFFDSSEDAIALTTYALIDAFPLETQYEPALVDYLIARALSPDDEWGSDQKVASFFGMAMGEGGAGGGR